MDILCLMGLFPKEYENKIINDSITGMQNAANKLQWAIIDGLKEQRDVNVYVLNSLFIGSFPKKYRKVRIPSFSFKIDGKNNGYNVGFLNLPAIKILSRYYRMRKTIDEWVNSLKKDKKIVIAYAMTSPIVELLYYIKSKYPEIKCILVVPDLPEYMDISNSSILYKFLKKKHITHLKKYLKTIDGYVLLTDYMKEWFDEEVFYIVIEGIYRQSDSVLLFDNSIKEKEKIILYSGGLYEEYGVLDLVNAFKKINRPEWKLELIGDGNLITYLKKEAMENSNIIVRGLLPNEQVLKRQRQVALLVNPRQSNNLFTKYSFPSKTIEYMASGTPMMGYRLPGIPDDYFEFIYEILDKEGGLESCIQQAIDLSPEEREEIGKAAKIYIQKEKNSKRQCEKIINMVNKLFV